MGIWIFTRSSANIVRFKYSGTQPLKSNMSVELKILAVKLSQAKAKGAKSKEFPKISGKTMRRLRGKSQATRSYLSLPQTVFTGF